MAPRLPARRPFGECDPAADPYSRKRRYTVAIRDGLEGRAAAAASRLHLSPRLLEAWANPADPQRGPLQTLDELLSALLELGATPEELEAPVALLARRIGRALVVELEDSAESVTDAAAGVARQSGAGVATALEVAADGDVDELEVARTRRELAAIRDRAARLEAAIERAHVDTVRRRQSRRPGNR
ncbi:MAG: hypothetical protein BWX64_00294 [Acidobacteria bacterium ADurb.Bin051]|nr:MAG: hypothetical protein BWX64_00294 [Acidobacteria bacterium ADurb.Bin051]